MAEVNKTFDLITVKAKNLELPSGTILLKASSKNIDTSLLARIMEPVYKYLNDYKKIAIAPAIKKYDKELEGITDAKEAEKLAKAVNEELKKLVGNLEKEAERRIAQSWETIKKENKDYAKWALKITAKVTLGVVKIAKSIAALIASSGAKADEYFKIAKSVYGIAKEVKKAIATETKVREDLMKACEKLSAATKDGKAGKSDIKKVKDTASEYEQKLTATRKKASSIAGDLDKLLDLQDQGVKVTPKQEKKINELITQIIDFNEVEQNGRKFAKYANQMADDTKGKMDLQTLKGHASKVKKGIDIAMKVFETAADIL